MKQRISTLDDFINEAATLFGDMEDYIKRFQSIPGFVAGETLYRVAGTPDEFPELDAKGDWRKDGWNYTSIRMYTDKPFKDAKEVLELCYSTVIKPNKKEWTYTNIRKPNSIFNFNKKDKTFALMHPALGFIFFYVLDNSTDWSRGRHGVMQNATYQVQGMFMNTERSWGEISNYPELFQQADDLVTAMRGDVKKAKAVVQFIKNKFPNEI